MVGGGGGGVAVLLDFAEGGKSIEIDLICYDLLFITIMLSNFFPGKKVTGKGYMAHFYRRSISIRQIFTH